MTEFTNPLEYLDLNRKRNWYTDIPMLIAHKSTKLWLGKGLLFNSEKKEILTYFNNKIFTDKWFEKLYKMGLNCSLIGKTFNLIYKTKSGNYSLRILDPAFNNRVAKYNEEEQAAEVFFMSEQADSATLTWVTINDKKVIFQNYKSNNDKEKEIIIGSVRTRLKPTVEPESEYSYNNPLGILPLVEITNLPVINLYGNSNTLNYYPDCYPVFDLIDDIQDTIRQKRVERKLNTTRAIGNFDNQTVKQIIEDSNGDDKIHIANFVKDFFLNVGSSIYNKNGEGSITVLQAQPQLMEYNKDYEFSMNQIFNGSGYDYNNFAGLNYENKTKTLMNNKFDMETTETKISHYTPYFYRLFDMLLFLENKWDMKGERPYSFKFIPKSMTDQILQNEIINSRLANGTLSQVEAISEYENINISQAKSKLDNIIKENEEFNKLLDKSPNNDNEYESKEKDLKGDIKDATFNE